MTSPFDAGIALGGPGVDGATTAVVPSQLCMANAMPIPERPLTLATEEVAIRLAGFLWRKPADAALLEAAAALRTTKDVAALAVDMQQDPRFGAGLDAFVTSWLELQKVPDATPSDFSGFDSAMAADMTESALRFARAIFADPQGTLPMLLTSSMVFFNQRLAPLYGVTFDGAAGEWQQTTAMAGQRAGVSTLLARMTASPRATTRGIWLQSRLLCQTGTTPLPPPDISSVVDPGPGSYRQKLETATSASVCMPCHQLVDPPGFAFEHFDDVGRFRQDDQGFAINAQSTVRTPSGDTLTFDGAADCMNLLASRCDVQVCFVQSWLGQAVGSDLLPFQDADTVGAVTAAFRSSGFRLSALLAAITETPAFLAP